MRRLDVVALGVGVLHLAVGHMLHVLADVVQVKVARRADLGRRDVPSRPRRAFDDAPVIGEAGLRHVLGGEEAERLHVEPARLPRALQRTLLPGEVEVLPGSSSRTGAGSDERSAGCSRRGSGEGMARRGRTVCRLVNGRRKGDGRMGSGSGGGD